MITFIRLLSDVTTPTAKGAKPLNLLQGALSRFVEAQAPNTFFNLTEGVIVTDMDEFKLIRLRHILDCWKVRFIECPFDSADYLASRASLLGT